MAGKYVNPLWVSEGMEVWIPWNAEKNRIGLTTKGTGLKCFVKTAFGDAAIVANEDRGISELMTFDSLWVPPSDPHAYIAGHVPKSMLSDS